MAKSLAHTVISLDQSAALQLNLEQSEVGTQQFRTTLASYLNLSLADIDAKNDVLLDYHFYNMVFAKKNGFTPLKTSAFLGIMKALLDEDVNADHRDVRQSFFRLKELLLEHSVERPPWSVGIFEEADIDPILTYATNNYFRHFRLYRMCMAPRVQMELKQHNPGFIELPAPSRPLSAAVEIFGKSLKTKDVQCVVVVVVAVVVVQPLVLVLWLDFNVVLVLVLSFLTQQLCFTCVQVKWMKCNCPKRNCCLLKKKWKNE